MMQLELPTPPTRVVAPRLRPFDLAPFLRDSAREAA